MFNTIQPMIEQWAHVSPNHLARVIQFALISARVRFYNVPATIEEALAGRDGALYGHKLGGWNAAWDEREANVNMCHDIVHNCPLDERDDILLLYLSQLPGLGLVKGGFVAQMAFGISGCIDTRNVQRFGMNSSMFTDYRFRPKRIRTLAGKLGACRWYNDKINALGGTRTLWDEWCDDVATTYPERFQDAQAVSTWHLTCLKTFPEGVTL